MTSQDFLTVAVWVALKAKTGFLLITHLHKLICKIPCHPMTLGLACHLGEA